VKFRLLLAALGLTLLAGCGGTPVAAPSVAVGVSSAPVGAVAEPASIQIHAIDVASTEPMRPLGLNPDGSMQVPSVDQPMAPGWYVNGPKPGEVGPSLIAAHVSGRTDGKSVPGLFNRLDELKVGDQITIGRADGTTVMFAVYDVDAYSKSAFPWKTVLAETAAPELILVTCGGSFDASAHSYRDNVVLKAREVS
jgi:hypothetical protein